MHMLFLPHLSPLWPIIYKITAKIPTAMLATYPAIATLLASAPVYVAGQAPADVPL